MHAGPGSCSLEFEITEMFYIPERAKARIRKAFDGNCMAAFSWYWGKPLRPLPLYSQKSEMVSPGTSFFMLFAWTITIQP